MVSEFLNGILIGFGGPALIILALGLLVTLVSLFNIAPGPILSVMIALTPIWLPLGLFFVTFERWMEAVRLKFALYNGRVSLRIKLPQEVFKSPQAMEEVLAQIHNVQSQDNLWQTYIDGKHPLYFCMELVSVGGEVRLYFNVPIRKSKNALEAQLYAQYPGIEVVEEPVDYTASVPYDPDRFEYMAFHMGKSNAEEFPIKTYVDMKLDMMPKEEEKIDPMTPMLEHLGNFVKPHEQIWIQFLMVPHAKQNFKTGSLQKVPTWEGRIQKKIDTILGRDEKTKMGPAEYSEQPRLTQQERDNISAMERGMNKYAYEVGIRWIYITEKGKFNGDIINPTLRTFASYNMITRNMIGVRWRSDYDYMLLSDPFGNKVKMYKRLELEDYKKREYWQRDYVNNTDGKKLYSVEELATMFHIPGKVVQTPTLNRIPSTRKEAPPNLPVGTPNFTSS